MCLRIYIMRSKDTPFFVKHKTSYIMRALAYTQKRGPFGIIEQPSNLKFKLLTQPSADP